MSNKNKNRNKKEKNKIKNEVDCGWYIEPGFLTNPYLTEDDVYGAIDEIHAYISLECESFDFGNGLLTPRMESTESAYLEVGLSVLYSYVGYDYSEREYIDVLMAEMGRTPNGCVIDYCECASCDSETAFIKNESEKIKYFNRKRVSPYAKKLKNLKRGCNIYKNRFLKVYFQSVSCDCDIVFCNCDCQIAKKVLGNGYYKYVDNRERNRVLKNLSNKRIRQKLKSNFLNYNNSLYKRLFDYYNLFD